MREQQDGNVEDRYRGVRHHPVFGGRAGGDGEGVRPARGVRRSSAGPRLVRPGVVPVPSRPAQPRRPVVADGAAGVGILDEGRAEVAAPLRSRRSGERAPGPRVLARRTPLPVRGRFLVRRLMAGAVLVVVVALAVVALGMLADAVAAARHPGAPPPPAPVAATVVVEAPGTVWDVADRIEPGASPSERAALVGRIVTANSLTAGDVRPGQVLAVPSR